jgi:hypothetical protein
MAISRARRTRTSERIGRSTFSPTIRVLVLGRTITRYFPSAESFSSSGSRSAPV